MAVVIGMDEAGYGPNLGPLVVTTTVWEVPGDPRETSFWGEFDGLVTATRSKDKTLLHIADSKAVHDASGDVGPLERGVMSALGLMGALPASFAEFWKSVSPHTADDRSTEPWFAERDLPLPQIVPSAQLALLTARWLARCEEVGIRLREIRSDLVLTRRFNELTRLHGSKGIALSRTSLALLGKVWNPDDDEPALIIADKHGGRNRYDELLQDLAGERFIFRVEEGMQRSIYRIGSGEIRFQTKAESHFPVALASMVCKYLRELSMNLFNDFWREHQPDLKPTKGYPVDAKRFRKAIEPTVQQLNIHDDDLWRAR